MSKVKLPAIIDGVHTIVELTPSQAKTVQAKVDSIIKGREISDLQAYRIGYNRFDASSNTIAASSHRTLKAPKVKGAIEAFKLALSTSRTPEERAKLFDSQLEKVAPDKAAPLWDVLFKLQGGRYEQQEQEQKSNTNMFLNIYNN